TFATVEQALRDFPQWREDSRRTLVLVRDLGTLGRIAESGVLNGEDINLGGIHYAAGRERVLPYLFLSPEERLVLQRIGETGAVVSARDLPSSRPVPLEDLLEKS